MGNALVKSPRFLAQETPIFLRTRVVGLQKLPASEDSKYLIAALHTYNI